MATDPSVWKRSVPFVEDGDPVDASTTNAPTRVVADRTANLKAVLDAIEAGEQLTLRDAPLGENVPEGSVVYLNVTSLEHDLAVASWQSLESSGGRLFPADSAVYTGIVVTKAADRVGDILMNGVGTLTANGETNLFNGATPTNTTYYLSMLNPGTIEAADPVMAVRVLKYEGDRIIRVFPPQHEPITHTHRQYELDTAEWVLTSTVDSSIVPDGAVWRYNHGSEQALAQNLNEALLPSVGEPSFTYLYNTNEGSGSSSSSSPDCETGGLHVNETSVLMDENGIWWLETSSPGCDIEMTVTSADTKGVALLHTIQSLSENAIEILVVNGRVTVRFLDMDTAEDSDDDHIVVKDIAGHIMSKGPVVSTFNVGVGLRRSSPQGDGVGDITTELALFSNLRIAAQIQNMDNAATTIDSPFVITSFPDNRLASVSCQVNIPDLSTGEYVAKIYAQFLSPDASQIAPDLSAIVLVGTPTSSGVTPEVSVSGTFPTFPGSVTAGDIYLLESDEDFDLNGFTEGFIAYTISADNPSKGLRMINTGIRLILP